MGDTSAMCHPRTSVGVSASPTLLSPTGETSVQWVPARFVGRLCWASGGQMPYEVMTDDFCTYDATF